MDAVFNPYSPLLFCTLLIIFTTSFCIFQKYLNLVTETSLVSSRDDTATISINAQHRQLEWIFVPTTDYVRGQGWYENYDDESAAENWDLNYGDKSDYLRRTDLCFDNGSYSRSFCPSPPNCDFHGKWGKAKLCINRAPSPDTSFFYVLVMKCIPYWENCDKCICGKITSNRKNGYCKYTGDSFGDDWIHMNCQNPGDVSVKNFYFDPPKKDKRNRKRRRKRNGQMS